ncbi:MAG: TAXI family TRAP transporter solute-binding subunit [Rhodospirillales bacterium]|nr:TAXI family TRAP transporter solute-binding subunit [Rhodospirillales bacterium]
MRTRRNLLTTTAIIGGLLMVGGMSAALAQAPKFGEKSFVRIGTAGSGGNTYRVGAGLAALFNEKLTDIKLQASVQATGGSTHNMELLANKEVEIATAGGSTAAAAYNNLRQYADKPKGRYKGVQFVSSIYPNPQWFVAMKWAPEIKSLRDLKGKRVAVGFIGSQGESVWRRISKIIGFARDDIKPEYTAHQSAIDQVRNRQIDAYLVPDAAGSATIVQMMETGFGRIVDMDADVIKAMTENTLDFAYSQPVGAVPGLDAPRKTWASSVVLVARADVEAELVYRMTKTIFENNDYLAKIHPITRFWKTETALAGQTGDVHPGAVRYYKEIGLLK